MNRWPELFEQIPEALEEAWDPQRPWDLLGEPLDRLLDALPDERLETPIPPGVHLMGSKIVLGKGVRLYPGAVLQGPLWVGEDAEIRPGAFVRGGCWIGAGCVVGASTEVKRAVLLPGAKAPHLNYVGDSVLGREVNLGAGTILSNFRHDGAEVRLPDLDGDPVATGRRKLGALLGDGVLTGCNCVLHPGVVVGRGSAIYPGVQLRVGSYPDGHMVKLRQQLEVVPLRD